MAGLGTIELYGRYDRRTIAEALGRKFTRYWQQGVVRPGSNLILFVTLDKSTLPSVYRYKDRFLSADLLQWESQNQDTRAGRGRKYQQHAGDGVAIHLFVRRRATSTDGGANPFVYLGQVTFRDWESDRPVVVRWALDSPIPIRLRAELLVPLGD
jgi:hypothetical protein